MSEYTKDGKPTGYSISVAEQASNNYATWMTAKQRELDEATALLRRIVKYARGDRAATPGVTRLARVLAEAERLLSRAPAQTAAPTPVCLDKSLHWCSHPHVAPTPEQAAGVNAIGDFYDVPAAPEPSAERCRVCGSPEPIDHGAEHMGAVEFPDNVCETCFRAQPLTDKWAAAAVRERDRAETAETQLAAVRGYMFSTLADSTYALKGLAAQRVREIVMGVAPGTSNEEMRALLTAPSPGAGEKT